MEFIMKKKKTGRPRKFKSPDEMAPLIGKYFADCDAKEQPYCVPGLAYSLGFSRRQSPADYARKYPEFVSTIKKAFLRIEAQRNIQLLTEGNPAGKIFDLVNNFGWENPQKIKHSADIDNISELLNNIAGATRGLPNRTQRKIRE